MKKISDLTAASPLDGTELTAIVQGGETVKATIGSFTPPIGGMIEYIGITVPTGWVWVPLEATTISRTTYSGLFTVMGDIDWFAPDSGSAAAAAAADKFHLPTLDDCYVRGGIHGTIASADNANNEITIEDQRGTTITDSHLRDGSPMRFYGTDLPSGLSNYTTYYLCWDDGESQWKIYTTEADAVSDSGSNQQALADDGSGTMYATQYGITLDDAFQGHWHEEELPSSEGSGVVRIRGVTGSGSLATGYQSIRDPITDGNNGTPRTSNESRGRTGYATKIIYTGV